MLVVLGIDKIECCYNGLAHPYRTDRLAFDWAKSLKSFNAVSVGTAPLRAGVSAPLRLNGFVYIRLLCIISYFRSIFKQLCLEIEWMD